MGHHHDHGADIVLSIDTGFHPQVYPCCHFVREGDWVTFQSDHESEIRFIAADGLFFLQGSEGATNTAIDQFLASPRNSNQLFRLCIAATPSEVTPFRIKIVSQPTGGCQGPPDGTINVGTRPHDPAPNHRQLPSAPMHALQARDLD